MRTFGFILAFAILFLGPSVAGSSGTNTLPGVGTFEYNGATPFPSDPTVATVVG